MDLAPVDGSVLPRTLLSPNDCVHLPGRLQRTCCLENRNAGPVKCSALFGGPRCYLSHSVSFTFGYFDPDKLWKVLRRTVFSDMLVLVDP